MKILENISQKNREEKFWENEGKEGFEHNDIQNWELSADPISFSSNGNNLRHSTVLFVDIFLYLQHSFQ